ncbi:MAG: hypothetical protein M1840_003021 [Geoglossum simile]|nr:MAG: hypothetical protein M1840_003021 [Geoglossum simile]
MAKVASRTVRVTGIPRDVGEATRVRLGILAAVILPSIVQMPCTKPHPKTPIRQSAHTPKPSARKRANSESISQPPPSSQCAKKTRIVTSLSVNPRRRQIAVDDIDDEEQSTEDEDTVSSTIDDDAINATQSKGQAEGMEEVEEVEEDDLIEEDAMRYPSVWKATVNTKETLCSKSGIYTESDLSILLGSSHKVTRARKVRRQCGVRKRRRDDYHVGYGPGSNRTMLY